MNTRLKHIRDWEELAREANWSASVLAKNCGVSLRTLERHFLREMAQSPKSWLVEKRHQIAIELLRDGRTVKETAAHLNYKHPSHLTNQFKKCQGECPTSKRDNLA